MFPQASGFRCCDRDITEATYHPSFIDSEYLLEVSIEETVSKCSFSVDGRTDSPLKLKAQTLPKEFEHTAGELYVMFLSPCGKKDFA